MKEIVKILLLGSLPKGDDARKVFNDWKGEYILEISKAIPKTRFLHGDLISDSEGPEVVVGHDLWLVKHADIIIVHAATKIGAGTSQEIVLAKKFKKPVISVIPKNSHHRKSNIVFHGTVIKDWVNPFLYISSDVIVENINQAIRWIKANPNKSKDIKDLSIFNKSIAKFEKQMPEVLKAYKNNGW